MKTDLIICEGALAKVTEDILDKDDSTISYYILDYIKDNLEIDKYKQIHSIEIFARYLIKRFVKKNATSKKNAFFVGKSLGVTKLVREMEDHYNLFEKYNKIGFLSVDGHSKTMRDVFKAKPPYGKRRDFKYNINWEKTKLQIANVYQQEKFPEGASFRYIGHNIKVPGVNHLSIINCTEVYEQLSFLINWLNK
jgi:hypothetical protein